MRNKSSNPFFQIKRIIGQDLQRNIRHGVVLLPVVMLAANRLFGDVGLVTVAVLIPLLYYSIMHSKSLGFAEVPRDATTGLVLKSGLTQALDEWISGARTSGSSTACVAVELDDFRGLAARLGEEASDEILQKVTGRMQSVLRSSDVLARNGRSGFILGLSPIRRIDLEAMIQLAARLHEAIEEPLVLKNMNVHLTACTGFCLLSRSPRNGAEALLDATAVALRHAKQQGAGSIRAFTQEMQLEIMPDPELRARIEKALSNGEIRPWYQPQVSTNTGKVTGVEALARWIHPDRGVVPPSDFLPIIDACGLSGRLGEVILYHALTALKSLDEAGTVIPVMGVNFSDAELRDPRLVERIRWELDRFDLAPQRLGIEILENVIADHDGDMISRNIKGLSELGCYIDLDDFGTGHASISSIRRFAIGRLKIDRSFVSKVDEDQSQQRMISAILTMAEQLQLETLAEGVETPGEHAMLAQLGCGHVQGFGVARPMPLEDLPAWIGVHEAKLNATLRIGGKLG
ncbi:putative bifunctional diguanylate cyclase/phosphodiesterase [Halocynthiibacter namhaensis]|uniref:putative bifunctional diguanylate cyclase/phosphodiesterase n=1 Tax=Halocynthiibacter namhaensis TaxID=1290553 RepID=UPI0009DE42BF|nr:bifunctional diguanylate cyclase/phosphodiesterase [Halocynthiibacter namhaensis]